MTVVGVASVSVAILELLAAYPRAERRIARCVFVGARVQGRSGRSMTGSELSFVNIESSAYLCGTEAAKKLGGRWRKEGHNVMQGSGTAKCKPHFDGNQVYTKGHALSFVFFSVVCFYLNL